MPFPPQRDEPEDRGKLSGDRQVWPEIDPDQERAYNLGGDGESRNGRACDQPNRQVVHEIAGQRGDQTRGPASRGRRSQRERLQRPRQILHYACANQSFDQNEQPGNERQHAPGNVPEQFPRRSPFKNLRDDGGQHPRGKGWQPERDIQ